jgi:hypothetical protein
MVKEVSTFEKLKTFRIFDRDIVLNELGVNDAQFRSFCAMCSSDYTKEEQKIVKRKRNDIKKKSVS